MLSYVSSMKDSERTSVTQEEFNGCMERIKAGDKDGLKEIYLAYISYIYTIIYGVVTSKENAEDLTQEFFVKLWGIADTYVPQEKGHKAYLATVARNMALDFLRKNKREILAEEMPEEADPKSAVEEEVISDVGLKEALLKLKESERTVVSMKILSDMTFQEIADALSEPLGTVTWRYKNALEKLRRYGYE